jgi:hypothetical protein
MAAMKDEKDILAFTLAISGFVICLLISFVW